MRLGIWTPAPQTIKPDPGIRPAFDALLQHGGGVDESYLYAVKVLQRAEQLGFDITLIAQRWLGPDLDSWIFATALATQTRTMDIMAAAHPGILDPITAAKFGASIDRISGGRFCINVVNGRRQRETEIFGDWIGTVEPRYRRMHEFVKVMKGLWTQDDFSFDGEFYKVAHGTVPTKSVRAPHPPFYAASRVDEGMAVVSQECDCWFVNYEHNRFKYAENLKRIESEVAQMEKRVAALGRRMQYGMNGLVIVADTDAQAERMADDYLEAVHADPFHTVGPSGIGANFFGTPKTIVERMRRYEAMGVGLFMLHFDPMHEGLEIFAERVLPELKLRQGAN